jgi:Hom_end-associated Hint/Homing endonuclease
MGHQINFTGEQGELVTLPVNHFRNIAQHIYVMITSNRPTMDARAINTDYKSLAQTYLARGILDYYMRERGLEDCLKIACEMAVVLGSGFIKMEWDATAGEEFDRDEDSGDILYQGDVKFTNLSPFDVVFDGTKEEWDNSWLMGRTFKNKFDLMAKYPEMADRIAALPSKAANQVYRLAVWSNDDTDDIPVYEFFHKKTEAMPEGRYLLFLASDLVLLDTPMPYRTLPIFRMVPGNILGTPYGYTPMFDIFPMQEAVNTLYSIIMTNNNAFGVQNLFVQRGSDITLASLDGAMNIVEGLIKPEPIQLTATAPETPEFLNTVIEAMETISGVNSVARGNPEASLKSGNALALVQSMALQFISGLQQSYVKLIENTGTALLQNLKDFAQAPRVVALVGKNNKPLLKEFTGDDIRDVNRVVVDVGNPLSKCLKKDTPILMYDGSIKMVQDVILGDLVMGPDSKPRTVISTNSDQEMMYDVVSKDKHQNVYYGCNESHILTLRYCSKDGRYGLKQYQEVDMSVKEYLSLSERHRRLFMGFKTAVEFEKKDLPIDPYILGAWLGDGTSRNTSLTTMDAELAKAWTDYGNSLGLQVRIQDQPDNKSKVYFITSGSQGGSPDRNPFQANLHKLNLILNKHIPQNYLITNREDRLSLLAGLLDTDGTLVNETFLITQKSDSLTEGIMFLARSLGFRVTSHRRPSYSGPRGKSEQRRIIGEYNTVTIGGNTWEIPTKLPRKQAKKKRKSRHWLNYGIEVKPVGIGTFYGFSLKEEPHFVLGDFTVTHNTIAGRVQMAEQLAQMKLLDNPQQYFSVLNTGELDMTFEGDMAELLYVKDENEQLLEGKNPLVSPMDQHSMHITEHKAVLFDEDVRNNPQLVHNVMDHIEDHLNALRNTDPGLLAIVGQHPLPPLPQPGMPPPGAPAPMSPPGAGPGPQGGPSQVVGQPLTQPATNGQIINQAGKASIPQPAKPPKPFQNLPTSAANLAPPTPK